METTKEERIRWTKKFGEIENGSTFCVKVDASEIDTIRALASRYNTSHPELTYSIGVTAKGSNVCIFTKPRL